MWSPLGRPVFRAVWIALVTSNIGTWMQSVGGAWLMTSLTPSPLLVALMQTAASLPILLLGLPAGALADVVDRRKLLLVTESWMLLVALALGVLTLAGTVSAWTLLALTFLMGLGAALDGPAWQAVVSDLVEREELPSAVALNIVGFNVARAVGPALGGFVVAAAGPAAVFILNAVSFLAVLGAIFRWRRTHVPSDTPPEAMLGATAAGMRYVRQAPALQAVLVRTGVFIFGASALWALLPIVARQELSLDATGYGIILGSLGLGAVAGAALLPRLRRSLPIDTLTTAATLVFALATLALAYLRFVPLVVVCMIAGGMAWMAVTSSVNVAAQTAAPAWVRARAVSLYILVFQGLMAVGGFAWGAAAQQFGNRAALSFAALALICGLATIWRWPLHVVQRLDLTPSGHWPDPEVAIAPDAEDGPVLITVEYRVGAERANDFITTMDEMRTFRRREGAISWGIFRDAADPDHYVETFLVLTWGEHLRQHARVTVEHQALEARRNAFLQPGAAPFTMHLIDAHTFDGRTSAEPPYAGLS
jgi:MFS family permease